MPLIRLEDRYSKAPVSESKGLELTTISPVHIGGRTTLSANRFLRADPDVAIVDEDKLFDQFARRRGLIDDYLARVREDRSWLGSFQFIQQMRRDEKTRFARSVAAYTLTRFSGTPIDDRMQLRPFIRDGEHHAYIPGTSIKGAIRTAVLYGQLAALRQSNPVDFNQILTAIRRRVAACRPSRNRPALDNDPQIELIEKILQDFSLRATSNSVIARGERSLFDFLKTLSISDTETADFNLKLCRIQLVSEGGQKGWHFSERNGRPIPIHAEVMPQDETFYCDGTVELFAVSRFCGTSCSHKAKLGGMAKTCFSNLQSVFAHLKRFAEDLLAFERGYFDDLYNRGQDANIRAALDEYERIIAQAPNLRIGWGSGLTGITIIRFLDDSLQGDIRDNIFGNRQYRRMQYFPKTRRFIVSQSNRGRTPEEEWNLIAPLGWCRLEVSPV